MKPTVRSAVLMVAVLVMLAGVTTGLLFVLPAALIVALLALGIYPAERALAARVRVRRSPRRVVRDLGSKGRTPHVLAPAGSALLAFKRASRPPPPSHAV